MDSKAPRAMMGKYFLMTHCIGGIYTPPSKGSVALGQSQGQGAAGQERADRGRVGP